jgi:hypothetical protein
VQRFRALENPVIAVSLIALIAVVASALIRSATKSPTADAVEQQQKADSAQEDKFSSIFKSGRNSFQDGLYSTALDQYAEAEKAVPLLHEDQYTALKNARQQIADVYANRPRAEAEAPYKTMIDSDFHDAAAQLKAGQLDAALERYQDAGKLADHLSDTQKNYRYGAAKGEIATLRRANRLPDAIQASQNLIDYLQASDPDDPFIVEAYMRMGETYQMQRDWQHLESALLTTVVLCDRILDQNSGVPYNQEPVWSTITSKDQTLYALVDAYSQDGQPDKALATAQTLYDFINKYSTQWIELKPHGRKDIARFAFLIASRAGRPDAADAWRAKINDAR